MCGIASVFAYHYAAPPVDREELRSIRDRMAVRGPDGSGEWLSPDGRAGLGHRRLSILDLTDKGAQPMALDGGRVVVSFNGEIYNHAELRERLRNSGRRFISGTDTEVLLHLYDERGPRMVEDLRGMFAFALWDSRLRRLFLVRDPFGIKPLYYADDGWTLRAASQVKALTASARVSRVPEPAAAAGFFLFGSVPEPFTFRQEIRQVPAGAWVEVGDLGPSEPVRYFRPEQAFAGTPRKTPLEASLRDSVAAHLVSDVPVGVFLSAGLDSSAIAASAARTAKPSSLTLSFSGGRAESEAGIAAATAAALGLPHAIERLNIAELPAALAGFWDAMDQPSIDGLNMYLVSRAARRLGWKVALTGIGADELLGGYASFDDVPRWAAAFAVPSRIPFFGRAARALASMAPGVHPKLSALAVYGGTYEGAYFVRRGLFMPWELADLIGEETAREGLRRLGFLRRMRLEPAPKAAFARVAALEASWYMRNQLLRDADWAGMAHSVEIRTPFVDKPLWESQGPSLASAGLRKKRTLGPVVRDALPAFDIERPKTGFAVPIGEWLETDSAGEWRRVRKLSRPGVHWSRRWAYEVYRRAA